MGFVKAVCISEKKGVSKKNVGSARFISNWGVENDAHGGKGDRQVSLLSYEKIAEFKNSGAKSCVPSIEFGAFGENLVIEGIELADLPIGTLLKCKNVVLEVSKKGKECHNHCQIYHTMGDCIMPREGVFASVIKEGIIQTGDIIEVSPA